MSTSGTLGWCAQKIAVLRVACGEGRGVNHCRWGPACPSANLRNANKRNKGEIAKSARYKLLAIQLKGQPACAHAHTCAAGRWTIKRAHEFTATGTLTFDLISQPLVWLRKICLDEQKAVVEAEEGVQCTFSTENHGAQSRWEKLRSSERAFWEEPSLYSIRFGVL